jgi:hypothetical protein
MLIIPRNNQAGAVAVEAALIFPALVLFLLGTVELTQYAWASNNVTRVSTAINSIVSSSESMDDDSLETFLEAATGMMNPNSINPSMEVKITSVLACDCQTDDKEEVKPCYFTLWSRQGNLNKNGDVSFEDPPYAEGSPFSSGMVSLPTDTVIVNQNIIVTETSFHYIPRFSAIMKTAAFDFDKSDTSVPRYVSLLEMDGATTNDLSCADLVPKK